ncbi:hypothetical protein WOLCODRAFT_139091 [Wolfiporia cocos MD-104 SS10]|uniref:Uncharacterized protein n=1 Tax=Wolfiporia cocos (strain MD-104) TaxID=742152 RepID=A0A2H3K6C0_WOLCO|nr:hypothetical protein WOLCODRAFT_139091 [Wolfiporia cocos MD-104 SS10]
MSLSSLTARFSRAIARPLQQRPTAQTLFAAPPSPPLTYSPPAPIPPPDVSNIFDLSADAELPSIHAQGAHVLMHDSAVEVDTTREDSRFSIGQLERSADAVFRLPPAASTLNTATSTPNTYRTASDAHASGDVVLATPPQETQATRSDPFAAHASTYYTPGSRVPPTPPHPARAPSQLSRSLSLPAHTPHMRRASSDTPPADAALWSLRAQLALQAELAAQFEADVRARDALVAELRSRLALVETKRKSAVDGWRRRVKELEEAVGALTAEVERSREESGERAGLGADAASGETVRTLQERIAELERERARGVEVGSEEAGRKETALRKQEEEMRAREEEMRVREEEMRAREEEMRRREAEQRAAREDEARALREEVERLQNASIDGEELQRQSEAQHLQQTEALRLQNAALEKQLADARGEAGLLRGEVEAQWRHAEKAADRAQELQEECAALKKERGSVRNVEEECERLRADRDRMRKFEEECLALRNEKEGLMKRIEEAEGLQNRLQEADGLHAELESVRAEKHGVLAENRALRAEIDELRERLEDMEDPPTPIEVEGLRAEMNALRTRINDMESMQARITDMETDFAQLAGEKNELEGLVQDERAAKGELEREIEELESRLRASQERAAELEASLREHEAASAVLEQEHAYALDRAARFEAHVRQRDEDAAELSEHAASRVYAAEALEEEMSRMKREHARIVDGQTRMLQDVVTREVEARARAEALVRERAEVDVQRTTMGERIGFLEGEVSRVRRQMHGLQQESADKEMKIVNLQRQRAQDKEDIQGLNIALDSKQQELELLKRRMGVRSSAGASQANASKTSHHRRESSMFRTPSVASSRAPEARPPSRPSSVLSDAGSSSTALRSRRESVTPKATSSRASSQEDMTPVPVPVPSRPQANPNGHTSRKRSLEGAAPPNAGSPSRIPSVRRPHMPSVPSGFPVMNGRRASSSMIALDPVRVPFAVRQSEGNEKENAAPHPKSKRMSAMAA